MDLHVNRILSGGKPKPIDVIVVLCTSHYFNTGPNNTTLPLAAAWNGVHKVLSYSFSKATSSEWKKTTHVKATATPTLFISALNCSEFNNVVTEGDQNNQHTFWTLCTMQNCHSTLKV